MKLRILTTVLIAGLALAFWGQNGRAEAEKYLVVLQAGTETHEGMARAVHALLYSKEMKESGYEVVLLFDGAGTEWVEKWSQTDTEDKLAVMYRELRAAGVTQVVCDFCAGAFHVKESLQEKEVPLTAEYQGHPSIVKWLDRGYKLLIL